MKAFDDQGLRWESGSLKRQVLESGALSAAGTKTFLDDP
jgi:hypothetical protein